MDYLKLLIADDEENIRSGLKQIINWESCGYKICGEASNGKDTVSQIIDLRPDIVLLDIKMPGMTGIEVIKQINEFCDSKALERPAFIILSGFSEFEFAKEAVNLGAKAYLLKPVDEDELQKIVLSVYEDTKKHRDMLVQLRNADTLKEREFFIDAIRTQNSEVPPECKDLRILSDYESSSYVCIIACQDFIERKEAVHSLKNILSSSFDFFNHIILQVDHDYIIIVKTSNQEAVYNCLRRVFLKIPGQSFVCCGGMEKGIQGFLESYNQAESLKKYLFYFSSEPFITMEHISSLKCREISFNLEDCIKKIIFYIETYDKEQLNKLLLELREYFFYYSDNADNTKKIMINAILELHRTLCSKYPEREFESGKIDDVVPNILEKKSFESCFSYFRSIIIDSVESFNFNTADSVIVKVIAYIKNNYTQDLKLEVLGDLFNCNSAYLGKKFKRYTGVQFNNFLDNLRIEDAKDKLIHTDLKIYQISKLVGYSNADYFFMKFKRHTGITPKEFKSQFGKSSDLSDLSDSED
ncbi:MAG: response regulator [Treponema sp.]|nr:response regulator [Treponema sp.]